MIEWITFHVTDRCQLNCDHCLRDPGQKAVDLEPELIASVIEQGVELYDIKRVGFTGGEPTLHPRFLDIVDIAVDRGLSWHMVTNGTRFDRVVASLSARPGRLERLTKLNLSLDGATEETHDGIRGAGSYRDVLKAVSICKVMEIPFLLQMAVHDRNVHEIEEMAMLASQLGACQLSFVQTQPTGTFLDRGLYLTIEEWTRVVDRIRRCQELFTLPITSTDSMPKEEPFHLCSIWRSEQLHVDMLGRMTLCCQHSGVPSDGPHTDVIGDLREMTLAQGHQKMIDLIHQGMRWRAEDIEAGLEPWDKSLCNWCLKRFGKPHWNEEGVGGPAASRQRWRGAWAPGYKRSHNEVGVETSDDVAPEQPAVAARDAE